MSTGHCLKCSITAIIGNTCNIDTCIYNRKEVKNPKTSHLLLLKSPHSAIDEFFSGFDESHRARSINHPG